MSESYDGREGRLDEWIMKEGREDQREGEGEGECDGKVNSSPHHVITNTTITEAINT